MGQVDLSFLQIIMPRRQYFTTATQQLRFRISGNLSSETELFDDSAVTFDIVVLEVAEKVASVTYHLVKTAAEVMVL